MDKGKVTKDDILNIAFSTEVDSICGNVVSVGSKQFLVSSDAIYKLEEVDFPCDMRDKAYIPKQPRWICGHTYRSDALGSETTGFHCEIDGVIYLCSFTSYNCGICDDNFRKELKKKAEAMAKNRRDAIDKIKDEVKCPKCGCEEIVVTDSLPAKCKCSHCCYRWTEGG